MIATVENLADTLMAQLKTREWVRVPASEAEYLALAEEFPYKIEYHEGEIIAMSLASFWHEVLVNSIGFLLEQYFRDKNFFVTNSNAGLQISLTEGNYYQPDLMVVRGNPVFKTGSASIITNPYLLVEVTSKSTGKYDKEEKLPLYRGVPGLEYTLLISQTRPLVTVESRTSQPNVWVTTDYKTLDSVAQLGDLALPLREIYHKITFSE